MEWDGRGEIGGSAVCVSVVVVCGEGKNIMVDEARREGKRGRKERERGGGYIPSMDIE